MREPDEHTDTYINERVSTVRKLPELKGVFMSDKEYFAFLFLMGAGLGLVVALSIILFNSI